MIFSSMIEVSVDGGGIENADIVVTAILLGTGLPASSGDIRDIADQFLVLLTDGCFVEGGGVRVVVHDIGPLLLHLTSRADLDYRRREAVVQCARRQRRYFIGR